MDPILSGIARLCLALLFAHSCSGKARDFERFGAVLADYRLLPERIVGSAAIAILAIEVGLTATLLIPGVARWAAAAAASVLLLYSIAIAINLARGRREIDCGCGGDADQNLHPGLLARNAMLIAAAVLASLPVATRSLTGLDFMTLAFGVTTIALFWLAGGRLASNPGGQRSASFDSKPLTAQEGASVHD